MIDNKRPVDDRLISAISYDCSATVHFVGVGGVSMYSLAVLTRRRGAKVSGSDRDDGPRLDTLRGMGIDVSVGHATSYIDTASLVVYSQAIPPDDPERLRAAELSIPTVSRAEYLGAIMQDYSVRIGVSGSHGKSTATAMLDAIFGYADYRHTTLSGADLTFGSPYRLGEVDLLIYEACEYKDSFLSFHPTVAIALNLELDHTDYFEGLDALKASFATSLGAVEDLVIINGDDENLAAIVRGLKCRVITYGSGAECDYRFTIDGFSNGYDFSVYRYGSRLDSFHLEIPGAFNLYNATAAIAAAIEQGISISMVREAISAYHGIHGRLEYIGSHFGRPVYLDYAHHPTEIAASISALRERNNSPITVVFMPHTYSRTASLWDGFVSSLSLADSVVVMDIFPAREQPIVGITSPRLASDIGRMALYATGESIIDVIDGLTDGTIVLMGAGNYDKIKKKLIKGL